MTYKPTRLYTDAEGRSDPLLWRLNERQYQEIKMTPDFRLCYVTGPWAWFTTQEVTKQWGDDWDDAPYEHNAREPYTAYRKDEHWELLRVAWEGPFKAPCDGVLNSGFSVQQINRGDVAWLRPWSWTRDPSLRPIPAGTTFDEFRRLVEAAGGYVYITDADRLRVSTT
jgi:hypothetical protein